MYRWTLSALVAVAVALLAAFASVRFVPATTHPGSSTLLPSEDDTGEQIRAVTARMEGKRQAAGELIAGRMSLLEAAAAFRDLDAEGPPPPSVRIAFPEAASADEGHCLSVVEYVAVEAPPDRRDELVRRLRDEVDARRRDGTLRLP